MADNKILISSKNMVITEALDRVDRDIRDLEITRKDGMHLRLIAEEALGMLKALAGGYSALVWIEQDGNEASVNITAKADKMDREAKREILSVSSSGKNASSKGFMDKIGDFIEKTLNDREDAVSYADDYDSGIIDFSDEDGEQGDMMRAWSLDHYRQSLKEDKQMNVNKEEVRDILEKSIVASLAKDVIVGVKKENVEMKIIMELTGK